MILAARELLKGCDYTGGVYDKLTRCIRLKPLGTQIVSYNGSAKECECWRGYGKRGATFHFAKFNRVRGCPKII